jgi:hypothetical protein
VDEGDEAAVRRFLLNLIDQFENYSHEEEAKGDGA